MLFNRFLAFRDQLDVNKYCGIARSTTHFYVILQGKYVAAYGLNKSFMLSDYKDSVQNAPRTSLNIYTSGAV